MLDKIVLEFNKMMNQKNSIMRLRKLSNETIIISVINDIYINNTNTLDLEIEFYMLIEKHFSKYHLKLHYNNNRMSFWVENMLQK